MKCPMRAEKRNKRQIVIPICKQNNGTKILFAIFFGMKFANHNDILTMKPSHLYARMQQFVPQSLVLASAVIAVAVYLKAIDYPFIYDDFTYITDNTKLAGLKLTELWRVFTRPYNGYAEFLPLRDMSYWFDMALFGPNPAAFRMHGIILYLLCLPLVYVTTLGVWRFFHPADAASAKWAAAAVTSLFALHPSHTEAVVWISGRKDVLCGMFSLLAIWLAVRTKREQGFSSTYAAATLVALLAAMLSKATAVAVAPLIALVWVIFWREIPVPERRRSLLLWPLASLLLAACIALIFATIIQSRIPIYIGIEAIERTLAVLGWLARLAISPENRHFFYPVFEDPYLPVMITLGVAVLVAAMAGMTGVLRRRSLEGFALVGFLLICAPSLQLIPYSPPSLVSDRFVFLAVWPAVLLVVSLLWRLNPLPRAAILLAIAFAWGIQAAERTRDWRSFEAVIDADMRAYPGYYMPIMYKVLNVQLKRELYRDAAETARTIADPKFRDIVLKFVEVDYATANVASGDPQQVMAQLSKLELELGQPPAQAMWNSPVNHLYMRGHEVLEIEWEDMTEFFPAEVALYKQGSRVPEGEQMKQ